MRDYRSADLPFLWDMLYEAAFWRPDAPRPPRREALSGPALSHYLEGFGHSGDAAVVAVDRAGEARVGAAWYRLMAEDEPGYGFVAPGVPELSIGVAGHSRGRGIGSSLLEALLGRAAEDGFGAISLSVEDDNPAVRLYERHGFRKLFRVENSWTMRAEPAERPS